MSSHDDQWVNSSFCLIPAEDNIPRTRERCTTNTPTKKEKPLVVTTELESKNEKIHDVGVSEKERELDADREVFDILYPPLRRSVVFRKSPIIRDDIDELGMDLPRSRCHNSLDPFFN